MTEHTLVLHPDFLQPGLRAPAARLAEAVGLAAAIGLNVAAAEVVTVKQKRPATLIGGGAVERMAEEIRLREVGVVVVDAALSPVQQRHLERAWACTVRSEESGVGKAGGGRLRSRRRRETKTKKKKR